MICEKKHFSRKKLNKKRLKRYFRYLFLKIFVMNLKKIIKKYLNEHKILNEYLVNDEISLYRYLSASKESKMEYLPHEYHYLFDDFLDEENVDFKRPKEMKPSIYFGEPHKEIDMFDDSLELINWLEDNQPEIYKAFAEYLYEKIESHGLPIPDEEYPSWAYFDKPKIIKNQWLIHFTDDAESIAREGFKYRIYDLTKLGLTTYFSDYTRKYGGYNFAFLLSDFRKYRYSEESYPYGDDAVIFNASGIRVWHYIDEQYQVIFKGLTAKNIIPILNGENARWGIYGKNGRLLYENDNLENVVNWVARNYPQYRKSLTK